MPNRRRAGDRCSRDAMPDAGDPGGAPTLAAGTVIQVLATDPAAAGRPAAWCRMRGHTVIGTGT